MWNPETNIKGPKGDKGDTGDQGIPGTPGADGASDWADITGKPSTFPPDPEAVDDRVAALLVAGSNITLTYNDTGNTLTIASTASGGGGSSVYVGPTPPVGAAASSLWFENDTGLLYINYNDGNSTQWVIVPPSVSAASIGAVAYTVQSPAASEQVQARKNVYAAPFDAMSYSGMQINGSMEVSQENGTGAVTVTGTTKYGVDGFSATHIGTGAVSLQQAGAPPSGFSKALNLVCSVANSLAGASDGQWISTSIEGYRWSRLAFGTADAQPVTIAFWVWSTVAGTMAVALQQTVGSARSYVVDVPVTASTWQYKTVTIPGDTSGTWTTANLAGGVIYFVFGVGSSRKTTANTWVTTGATVGTAATTNFFAAPGSVYITGVTILPGIEAPSAARSPLIMRPYDQELVTCQRYWRTFLPSGAGLAATAAEARFQIQHHGMRAAPTPASTGILTISNIGTSNYTQSSPHMGWIAGGPDGGEYNFGNFAGMTASAALIFRAGNLLRFDARL